MSSSLPSHSQTGSFGAITSGDGTKTGGIVSGAPITENIYFRLCSVPYGYAILSVSHSRKFIFNNQSG